MKIVVAVIIAALAAGCSHGTSVTTGSAGLQARSESRGLANAVIAVGLVAGAIEYSREDRPFPSPAALLPENTPPIPALAPDRRISEQDCTRPVDYSLGNIRCK
jgi:hypothetical protein